MAHRRPLLLALALLTAVRPLGAQAAVGVISGTSAYAAPFTGYVAILDLASGAFTPVVTAMADSCRTRGLGPVSLLRTGEFAVAQGTLVAITANTGPAIPGSDGVCATPDGLIVSDGALVQPGQTAGPILYFSDSTHATITDGALTVARWAVAGTTVTGNDCAPLSAIGTLLVRGGAPGPCVIPKSTIAAGRGAAGLDSSGRYLILAVVMGNDGAGLRTSDFAALLIGLGATSAVNFDGGGSTVFYWSPGGGAPTLSATGAAMIAAATFPAGLPNPGQVSFSAALADQTQPISADYNRRPVYASLGFLFGQGTGARRARPARGSP